MIKQSIDDKAEYWLHYWGGVDDMVDNC